MRPSLSLLMYGLLMVLLVSTVTQRFLHKFTLSLCPSLEPPPLFLPDCLSPISLSIPCPPPIPKLLHPPLPNFVSLSLCVTPSSLVSRLSLSTPLSFSLPALLPLFRLRPILIPSTLLSINPFLILNASPSPVLPPSTFVSTIPISLPPSLPSPHSLSLPLTCRPCNGQ